MENKVLIHIGFIKFIRYEGYGFIVDFLDNSDYYFRKESIMVDKLPDDIVSFKIRKSKRDPNKFEAYAISPLFYNKRKILEHINDYPIEIQKIISVYLTDVIYKYDNNVKSRIDELIGKYDALISELHEYVKNFDLEKFLDSYIVETESFYSASPKDWDWNSLDYVGYIGEPYSNLKSIYKRCNHYEGYLVWDQVPLEQNWHMVKVFDTYLFDLSYKSKEIKSTTAYGRVASFCDDLDKADIKSTIPQLTQKWKEEIKESYNRKDHLSQLIRPLEGRFSEMLKNFPMVIDSEGKEYRFYSPPDLNLTITYPNGHISFKIIYSYMGYYHYGYDLKQEANGRTSYSSGRCLEYPDDYIESNKRLDEIKSRSKEMFKDIVKKYLVF